MGFKKQNGQRKKVLTRKTMEIQHSPGKEQRGKG